MYRSRKLGIIFFIMCLNSLAMAKLWVPSVIGNGMVLQQGIKNKFWGNADPGAQVSVSGSWMEEKDSTIADATGKWQVKFIPPEAGGPYTMTISSDSGDEIKLKNVLCGEVWLCSGQSNMEWPISKDKDSQTEINQAKSINNIRLFNIPKASSYFPKDDVKAKWEKCDRKNIENFSAVGYYFGKQLYQKLNVPIGLIQAAWAGSNINGWMPIEAFTFSPTLENSYQYKQALQNRLNAEYQANQIKAIADVKKWIPKAEKALSSGQLVPQGPNLPKYTDESGQLVPQESKLPEYKYTEPNNEMPAGMYNAMINPIVGIAIKGCIWYQGESNRRDGSLYTTKTAAMLKQWRNRWDVGDFPYYYVQIAPFEYNEKDRTITAEFWEAQNQIMDKVKNTGMVVISDYADTKNLHPTHKAPVGKRLARWALAKNYGKDIVYCGPRYKSMKVKENKIILFFDYAEGGLASRNNKKLTWFEIAGEDEKYVEANANIKDDTVEVWSDKITQPKYVRFAWNELAQPNLMNKEGLPAIPFRTNAADYALPED